MHIPKSISHMVGNLNILVVQCLYHEGQDGILHLCIEPSEKAFYHTQAHQSPLGIHLAGRQNAQALLRLGVYWSSMRQDVYAFVQLCAHC